MDAVFAMLMFVSPVPWKGRLRAIRTRLDICTCSKRDYDFHIYAGRSASKRGSAKHVINDTSGRMVFQTKCFHDSYSPVKRSCVVGNVDVWTAACHESFEQQLERRGM